MLAQVRQLVAEVSLQLAECHVVSGLVGRADEVSHGFSLREVHLAVEEGTLSELTRSGSRAAVLYQQRHHPLQYIRRAMTGNLRGVFARVRMRSTEHAHQHFVHGLSLPVGYPAEGDGVWRSVVQLPVGFSRRREYLFCYLNRLIARDSYYSYRTALCGGYCAYRWVVIHFLSFNKCKCTLFYLILHSIKNMTSIIREEIFLGWSFQ